MLPYAVPPRRRRRLVIALVAAGSAVLVAVVATLIGTGLAATRGPSAAGRTVSVSPGAVSTDQRNTEVTAALAGMQRAVADGNETAFLASVDPSATAFRTHWRTVFQNLQVLRGRVTVGFDWPNRRWYYAEDAVHHFGSDAIVAAVAVRQRFTGYDPVAVTDVIGLTFAPKGGHWYLESDSQGDDLLPLGGESEPWAFGPIAVAQRGGVIVVGDQTQAPLLGRLARLLDTALVPVRTMWPTSDWNGRVVAYASTDAGFVKAWFGTSAATGSSTDPSGEATFDAKVRVLPEGPVFSDADYVPGAPRLVVTPYLLSKADSYAKAVLRHELTHVALARVGQRRPPTWMVEGVAEYTGFRVASSSGVDGVESLAQRGLSRQTWSQLKAGSWHPRLISDDDTFYAGTEQQVDDAYTTAWFTCMYIADHYGEAKLRALYTAAATAPDSVPDGQLEAIALRQVLHISRSSLQARVKAYAQQLRSHFV